MASTCKIFLVSKILFNIAIKFLPLRIRIELSTCNALTTDNFSYVQKILRVIMSCLPLIQLSLQRRRIVVPWTVPIVPAEGIDPAHVSYLPHRRVPLRISLLAHKSYE